MSRRTLFNSGNPYGITVTGGGGGPATDHSTLTNLSNDDHPQYILVNGTRPMTGNLSLGGNSLTSTANITITGTLNTAGTTGDLIVGSSGTLARVPIGSAGQILTVSGGTISWANNQPQVGTTVALSNGAATTIESSTSGSFFIKVVSQTAGGPNTTLLIAKSDSASSVFTSGAIAASAGVVSGQNMTIAWPAAGGITVTLQSATDNGNFTVKVL